MKMASAQAFVFFAVVAIVVPNACAIEATPVGKAIQLLTDLQGKILGEGKAAQKAYAEYSEWCEERSRNVEFDIKTQKGQMADLEATIAQEVALIGALTAKVEDLAAAIATDEADLKAAGEIRSKESADFGAEEKELMETIDILERAIGILGKEMKKTGSASMMELKSAGNIVQALSALVQASVLNSADATKLTALVQSSQKDTDSDDNLGAPAAQVYKGQSRGIIEVLTDLLEQAQDLLSNSRKKEISNTQNYQMLKQSLDDEVKVGEKDMAESKKAMAVSGEKKAGAEGDLAITSKDTAGDVSVLGDLHQLCLTRAQDYEAEVKSRGEELAALAAAKKALVEMTSSADAATYGMSFLQIAGRSSMTSDADLANFEAVRFVRDLAQKEHSTALAQLAARMASVMRSTAGSSDPFGKVKDLIRDMLERLESEASADATHKQFCDKELAESHVKKDDKASEISKLSTQIDQMTARSSQLKAEVAALSKALSELAASQAEMDKMRREENAAFIQNKADMEQGVEGVKLALRILREYYAVKDKDHEEAEGAGTSIIGLLEVVESDFTKALAGFTATEDNAKASYDQQTKDNQIEKTTKDQDIKYKTKESSDLDKAVAEAFSDRAGVQTELDAVMEYIASLAKQCITTGGVLGTAGAEGESYATRQQRRQTEIAGLKEALSILEGEAVLLQSRRSGKRMTLRGMHQQALQ